MRGLGQPNLVILTLSEAKDLRRDCGKHFSVRTLRSFAHARPRPLAQDDVVSLRLRAEHWREFAGTPIIR